MGQQNGSNPQGWEAMEALPVCSRVYVNGSFMFQRMKREEYGENKEVGNIEKNVFVIFGIFLKQSKKEKNSWLLTTNGSTNHANLLVMVASHVSLVITSSWFKSVSKHDPYNNFHIQTQHNKDKLHLNHQN